MNIHKNKIKFFYNHKIEILKKKLNVGHKIYFEQLIRT